MPTEPEQTEVTSGDGQPRPRKRLKLMESYGVFSDERLKDISDKIIVFRSYSDLKFLRLLINQVDRRTAMTKVTIDQLKKNFSPDQIFKTMIPVNAAFQRAENERKTIIRYDPTTLGAKSYRALATELLDIFPLKSD